MVRWECKVRAAFWTLIRCIRERSSLTNVRCCMYSRLTEKSRAPDAAMYWSDAPVIPLPTLAESSAPAPPRSASPTDSLAFFLAVFLFCFLSCCAAGTKACLMIRPVAFKRSERARSFSITALQHPLLVSEGTNLNFRRGRQLKSYQAIRKCACLSPALALVIDVFLAQ